jgi:hypothetical protein
MENRIMAKRGRPFALDDIKRGEIVALISAGCGISDAARYVGCSVNTINRDASRDPSFHKRMREAFLAAELKPLQSLRQASTHHWRAAAWLLKRMNPDRYARKKEGTYTELDFQDFADQLIYVVRHEILDQEVLNRIGRRISSVRNRWEHERVTARAMSRAQDRGPRGKGIDLEKPFPVIGHPIYKDGKNEGKEQQKSTELVPWSDG